MGETATPTHATGSPDSATISSTDPGKLFVGGLSWATTPDSLKNYFQQKYGELKECFIMCDPVTRRSRGFGFITFANVEDSDKVIASEPHILDGKKIDPKKAFPKVPNSKYVTRTKKIFVGGIQHGTTEKDLQEYFGKFGNVTDVTIMFDKITTRCRGFGFVTFESEDCVDKCCDERYHIINSKRVECKKAQPKDVMFPPQGRGIYLGRGVITRPGYVYSRADYSPVIGYFQPQFPPARTRFVSPTPPRTRAYYHGYDQAPAFVGPHYGEIIHGPPSYGVDRRAITSNYLTNYNQVAVAAIPAGGMPRGRELSSSPTTAAGAQPAAEGYPDGYTHFPSPMYSPFSASPSPSNPQHYRTQQLNGPDSGLTSNTNGLSMPAYNSLTASSTAGYGNNVNPSYSQAQRQF